MGNSVTGVQWFSYGKYHFLKAGFQRKEATLRNNLKQHSDSSSKNIIVTGANSGLGYALTKQLIERGHRVYMLCRNQERADAAREKLLAEAENTSPEQLVVLLGDCGDPVSLQKAMLGYTGNHLDALVCNAGTLFDTFTLNASGSHEFNLSVHVIHGYLLLAKLCMPFLTQAQDPRVIAVSSGGMYMAQLNMQTLTGVTAENYNGQTAYCQAKRAQVVLTERMKKEFPQCAFFSCHPGWAITPGVERELPDFVRWTGGPEKWRTPSEGTLGIAYLSLAKTRHLNNGEFYLDGEVAPKMLPSTWYSWAGSSTGSSTRTSDALWEYCFKETRQFT